MTLKPGDQASLWHEGTQKFYLATIIKPQTPEEALGPEEIQIIDVDRLH